MTQTQRTTRDKRILRGVMFYLVGQFRQNPSNERLDEIGRIFVNRRRIVYDHSPLPIPVWLKP